MKYSYAVIIIILSCINSNSQTHCPSLSTLKYAGKTYHTVQIGEQCWLKENLNIGTMIKANQEQSDNKIIEKYCFDDYAPNCEKYGGLYLWSEAMQYSRIPGAQGICPSGWHIPTKTEFNILASIVNNDGNKLKLVGVGSDSGLGTNTSGFSALMSSDRNDEGAFDDLGYSAFFWGSTQQGAKLAFDFCLGKNDNEILQGYDSKALGVNIRCIKDK